MTAQIILYQIKVKGKKIKLIHFAEDEINCLAWWDLWGEANACKHFCCT